jgi:glutaredoxin-like YruB-family protein
MEDVKVFGTEACPWCHRVKAYLKEKNVEFEYVDVANDQEAAITMVRESGQPGVPQVWIGNSIIIGFNQEKIDELLNL